MCWSEKFQVSSRKGINDKCQKGKDGTADWYRTRDGRETAGGKRTKSIDDVSKENQSSAGSDVGDDRWRENMLYLQAH